MNPQLRILGPLFLAAAAAAQAPHGSLVVSQGVDPNQSGQEGLVLVDPVRGLADRVAVGSGVVKSTMTTIALDPADGSSVYAPNGFVIGIAIPVVQSSLAGNVITGETPDSITNIGGTVERYRIWNGNLLFTLSTGAEGLHMIGLPANGQQSQGLLKIQDAKDIVVLGNTAYVQSYAAGSSSEIQAVDLNNPGNRRVVGTGYPTLRSMTAFQGQLIAGTDSGDLHLIDPPTGAATLLFNVGPAAIVAMAEGLNGVVYYANDKGEVHTMTDPVNPVYQTGGAPVEDMDVARHQEATVTFYGTTCPTSLGSEAAFVFTGVPALGNNGFALRTTGVPGAPALLALGFDRQNFLGMALPFPLATLTGLTAPGCPLLTAVDQTTFGSFDGAGVADWPLPIPSDPALAGLQASAQVLFLDGTDLRGSRGIELSLQ